MSEYDTFPPYEKFKKVLSGCPQAALFYISMWRAKKPSGRVIINKKELKTKFLTSKTLVRNYLLHLAKLELVTSEEGIETFIIDLVV